MSKIDVFTKGQKVIWDNNEWKRVGNTWQPIFRTGRIIEVRKDTLLVRTGLFTRAEVLKIKCGILNAPIV